MAPQLGPADKVRILVATDNHVGYGEHFPERRNDSWNTFEEIMTLAKERDVDMVLLAGDLFHDNKPSRRSMIQVMRILRANCLGDKPCQLEMLSDQSDTFVGYFNHVNYEDQDINVSLPVFSIHGNHDDPSGDGAGENYAALDVLSMAGLVNYYGRVPSNEKIQIKPVLLQKGRTKLALFGMGNVRDERLWRAFRDGKVKFFRPSTQQTDWFNIMSVHQNHVAHSEKNFLPEDFLPDFLDLVIWGHEHECVIDPKLNEEMGFHVMQPGSSVATSLMPGEAVPKQVAILTVAGKDFEVEKIRLKTVRPFVIREIILMDDPVAKKLVKKENHRQDLTRRLNELVYDMIEEARQEWRATKDPNVDDSECPLPLVRLRVDYSAPEGSAFDLENVQRFSSAFSGKVANPKDVLQVHQRKKRNALARAGANAILPDRTVVGGEGLEGIRVDKLVKEFLDAQSLTILPQNSFGDAVSQYVDKDDKHAVEMFVSESLKSQVKHLVELDEDEDEDERIAEQMQANKEKLEELFAKGHLQKTKTSRLKPKPETWESDIDGHWAEQPGARVFSENEADSNAADGPSKPAPKGRGKGKATTTAKPATKKAAATKTTARGRKKAPIGSDEDSDSNVSEANGTHDPMILDDDDIDDDDDDDDDALFVKPAKAPARGKKAAAKAAPAKTTTTTRATASMRKAPARAAASASHNTSQQSSIASWAKPRGRAAAATQEEPEEISSDGSDDFEPMQKPKGRR